MGADELLRRYLEQRREMGETELVLDGMDVEEVLRMLGARRSALGARQRSAAEGVAPKHVSAEREVKSRTADDLTGSADWRDALRGAGSTPESKPSAERRAPSAEQSSAERRAPSAEHFSAEQFASLEEIAAAVRSCTRCPLHRTATQGVPGEGNPHAQLMLVGEAPGATEDQTGRPFVGQAGQLLTKILEAINFSRDDVFIVNVLKHRPPGNRNPMPDEVTACKPYLVRQVELVKPAVIIALGTFAAQTLLDTKLAIGKLRGAVHQYHGVPVVVTYHPAALLRNPAWKRPTWEDVQLARRLLDSATA